MAGPLACQNHKDYSDKRCTANKLKNVPEKMFSILYHIRQLVLPPPPV